MPIFRFATMVRTGALLAGALVAPLTAAAQGAPTPLKIGLILPMTGGVSRTGQQINAAVRLYVQQHGDTVAGRKIELLLRDDVGVPDNSKRIAQELVVNDKVDLLAGFGLTPLAYVSAPLATQAKMAQVVMGAGTSDVTQKSPYIVRTAFTLPQSSAIMADWAAKNGIQKVVTMVSDFAPGIDAQNSFVPRFQAAGGQIIEQIRFPAMNPDFAPFLQRARDDNPDAIFVFVLAGQGGIFMKQFAERGLDKTGIKVIGPGDVTDDDLLPGMGDAALGAITAHFYSAAHPSALNKAYVAAMEKGIGRPNFMSVGGYDGMHLIYAALEKTGGKSDGGSLLAAMKGMQWESPRGPIAIDPQTRDIIQNIYVRKVERVDGQLYNVEFATFPAVKDPGKEK